VTVWQRIFFSVTPERVADLLHMRKRVYAWGRSKGEWGFPLFLSEHQPLLLAIEGDVLFEGSGRLVAADIWAATRLCVFEYLSNLQAQPPQLVHIVQRTRHSAPIVSPRE
jgi:hypothetical protein